MKKFICICLCVVMAFSLAACTSSSTDTPVKETGGENTEVTQPEKEDIQPAQEETFGLNETAAFSKLKFTATELEESEGEGFFTPDEGKVFVGIKFTIENVSDEDQAVSSVILFDGYVDDVACSYSFSAQCVFNDGTIDGNVAPGKKLVGWYALEVPKDWKTIELHILPSWLAKDPAKFVFNKQ